MSGFGRYSGFLLSFILFLRFATSACCAEDLSTDLVNIYTIRYDSRTRSCCCSPPSICCSCLEYRVFTRWRVVVALQDHLFHFEAADRLSTGCLIGPESPWLFYGSRSTVSRVTRSLSLELAIKPLMVPRPDLPPCASCLTAMCSSTSTGSKVCYHTTLGFAHD